MSKKKAKPTKHSPAPKPGDYMRYDEFILLPICTDDPESVLISGMKGGRRKPREEVTPLDAVDHLVEQYYLLMQKCASAYLHGAGWEDAGLIPCRRTAYVEAEDKAEEKLGEIRRVIEQYPTSFFQPGESVNTSDFELPNPFDLDCQNFADWKKEAKRVRFANTRRRLNISESIERTKSSGKNAAAQPSPPASEIVLTVNGEERTITREQLLNLGKKGPVKDLIYFRGVAQEIVDMFLEENGLVNSEIHKRLHRDDEDAKTKGDGHTRRYVSALRKFGILKGDNFGFYLPGLPRMKLHKTRR